MYGCRQQEMIILDEENDNEYKEKVVMWASVTKTNKLQYEAILRRKWPLATEVYQLLDGDCFVDVRPMDEKSWVRCKLNTGDVLVVPKNAERRVLPSMTVSCNSFSMTNSTP